MYTSKIHLGIVYICADKQYEYIHQKSIWVLCIYLRKQYEYQKEQEQGQSYGVLAYVSGQTMVRKVQNTYRRTQ